MPSSKTHLATGDRSREVPATNHQSPITNHQSPITNHQSLMTYSIYVCPSCYSENISLGDYVNAFTCSDCGCHFPEAEEVQIPGRVTTPEYISPAPSLEENLGDIPF
ncbi:hypothetical protein [Sphaerospermopsis sp. LEGE 08334]|uniref:hypothetical protein n=1 Tax=Sphaerospermopsis sp. LEGE 08334 TaxID=1828651 RepID=UPI001880289A|nr:hypothetical protein [Sphaerospermopsis sp. LEGE 08334]MBE9056337.1 hypothetical protein [Sphaerospermopsis sp. LEGE 08334]